MTAQLAHGKEAVVASGHALATEAAIAVLKQGGNAIDAAIAAGFVLTVVAPYATSLAGDAFVLVRDPRTGTIEGWNGTGAAPQAATRALFGDSIDRSGPRAATVPGLVACFADLHRLHGTKPWPALLAPAMALARDGFAVHPYLVRNIVERRALLEKDPALAALLLPSGAPIEPGARLMQPALARALSEIADEGADAFYRGGLAKRWIDALRRQGGLLSTSDLDAHRGLRQAPVGVEFYGNQVWTMPPNSYGATGLLQLLALERGAIDRADPDGADFILAGLAARREAYGKAARWIGDPTACEAPLRALLAAEIANAAAPGSTVTALPAGGCTTNVTVIDGEGFAVSLIESISMPFGAGTMVDGMVLNNRLGGFDLDPASHNCLTPGKRPAHTLAPCLVTGPDELVMALGTPGTVGQTCCWTQFLARVLACGETVERAASQPRWSVDLAGTPILEDTASPALVASVRAHEPSLRIVEEGWISFGSIKLAMAQAETKGATRLGVADHRRSATVLAY